jgi:hypothetical protein
VKKVDDVEIQVKKAVLNLIIRNFTNVMKPLNLSVPQTLQFFQQFFGFSSELGFIHSIIAVPSIQSYLNRRRDTLIQDHRKPDGDPQKTEVSGYEMDGFGFECQILALELFLRKEKYSEIGKVMDSFCDLIRKILSGFTTSEEVCLGTPDTLMNSSTVGYLYLAIVYAFYHEKFINDNQFPELKTYVTVTKGRYTTTTTLSDDCMNDPAFRSRVIQCLIQSGMINLYDRGNGIAGSLIFEKLMKEHKENITVRRYILLAFNISGWIHHSCKAVLDILGKEYHQFLPNHDMILQRMVIDINRSILTNVESPFPDETTIGSKAHDHFSQLEHDIIDQTKIKFMMMHAKAPIPNAQNSGKCMHPGCDMSCSDYSNHEKNFLFMGEKGQNFPRYLLSFMMNMRLPAENCLSPILHAMRLMFHYNPGVFSRFERMFGSEEHFILHEWWSFAANSYNLSLLDLVKYRATTETICFVVERENQKNKPLYVSFSLKDMSVVSAFEITDLTDKKSIISQNRNEMSRIEHRIKSILADQQRSRPTFPKFMHSIFHKVNAAISQKMRFASVFPNGFIVDIYKRNCMNQRNKTKLTMRCELLQKLLRILVPTSITYSDQNSNKMVLYVQNYEKMVSYVEARIKAADSFSLK